MHSVQIVSLGPGEADLITVKGLKTLQAADAIFYPTMQTKEGVVTSKALDILAELPLREEQFIPFHVPMSKVRTDAMDAYRATAKKIAELFQKKKRIAVVAEGDAGFYSSAYHVAEQLHAEAIPTAHIAGIPAFLACSALGGLHLTQQEEELQVLPGRVTADDLMARLQENRVLVIMKLSQSEEELKHLLDLAHGYDFHYFEQVGMKAGSFYTAEKEEIKTRKFPYFSLMIIRKRGARSQIDTIKKQIF